MHFWGGVKNALKYRFLRPLRVTPGGPQKFARVSDVERDIRPKFQTFCGLHAKPPKYNFFSNPSWNEFTTPPAIAHNPNNTLHSTSPLSLHPPLVLTSRRRRQHPTPMPRLYTPAGRLIVTARRARSPPRAAKRSI